MPGDIFVQTYAKVPDGDELKRQLTLYRDFLMGIGYKEDSIDEQLSEIKWLDLQDYGFISTLPVRNIPFGIMEIPVSPHIDGFIREAMPEIGMPWIEMSLTIDLEVVTLSPHSWRYKAGMGGPLWQLVRTYSSLFRESGIYITDDAGNGQPWYAIHGANRDLWMFDLALIPKHLAKLFVNIPSSHTTTQFEYGNAFARTDAWDVLPWEQPADSAT